MRVNVLDIGLGNIQSVCNAFEHLGVRVHRIQTHEEIKAAENIVLPGVGAFGEAMTLIGDRAAAIQSHAASGKPYLGICLGMQLMMQASEEFGTHRGLGLFSGTVRALKPDLEHPVPHVGWTEVEVLGQSTMFEHIPKSSDFYFVHSYSVAPLEPTVVAGLSSYGSNAIVAAVTKASSWGVQFHPEKSGEHGLQLLKNWINLSL